jgi:alpha-2-macroglobulin
MRAGQQPTTGGTLKPDGEALGARDESAFRVVFSAPEGEGKTVSEISVVFSRSLRALEVDAPPPPIAITPPLPGKWLWVGARALRFVPAELQLPNATEFSVEVPASTTALDGSRLGEAHRFSFRTPRPKLTASGPTNGETGLVPNTKFSLYFSQAMDPLEVERRGKLRVVSDKGSRPVAFKARREDPQKPKIVLIEPTAPLPLASRIELELAAGLSSEEGKLPSESAQTIKVETYYPLSVTNLECQSSTSQGTCRPRTAFVMNLNNRVRWSEIKRAVRVTPDARLSWPSWNQDEEDTQWVTINGNHQPATTYTVTVDAGLTDIHGQRLGKAFSRSIRVGDFDPVLALGIEGETLPPSDAKSIPLGYRNLPSFELVRTPVTPELVMELSTQQFDAHFEMLHQARGAKYETVRSSAPRNQIGRRDVDPLGVLGPSGRGVLAVATRYIDPQYKGPVLREHLVKISDLGITAKMSRHGSLIWVNRLSTGSAVPGATVELLQHDGPRKSYVADSSGLVHVPAADYAPDFSGYDTDLRDLVVVRSNDDWTYEALSDYLGPWRFGVNVDLSGSLETYGLLFTERGVYRPGDEVALKGIVRDEIATGNGVPKNRKYELSFRSSEDEEVATQTVTTSEFGTFSTRFKIPATGKLGTYRVTAKSAAMPGQLTAYLEVAEYRPAEFEVAVEPREKEISAGATARFTVRGDYLYGAPMAGASLDYSLGRERGWVSIPEHEAFSLEPSEFYQDYGSASLSGGSLANGQGKLAADGSFVVEQLLTQPGQHFPEVISLSAGVSDATRQVIGATGSVMVHPADFYLGIKRLDDYFFTAPRSLAPEVVAVTTRGQRLAGKKVSLELVRRRWTLSRQDVAEESHSVSSPVDEVVSRCTLLTQAVPASCKLEAKAGGYYVVMARSLDDRKRPVESSLALYGLGDGEYGWGDNDRGAVELVANKKSYRVGDTARILIKSPFKQAEALVTVERSGVYRSERIQLKGGAPTIEVPITAELAPNAFVGVHLIVPRGSKQTALGAPYRQGYTELSIDPEARRLKIAVKPLKRDLLPGQEAEIELAVSDRAGKGVQAELAVYAVDEGVLMLTGYQTPDPVPVFGRPRPLQVATLETREGLAKISLNAFEALGEDKGADGGGGGLGDARRDFRQVAYFEPKLLTDAQGKGKVRFKLPDTLTSYRVMAVAASRDDRYGYGDSRVTASKPLMIRPALPRFVRAGDQFELSAVIAAKGETAPGKVTVQAQISGATLQGSAVREVSLAKGASAEVRFPLRADQVGTLKVAFSATSTIGKDSVLLERAVKLPLTLETVAVYGETKAAVAEKLGDLGKLRADSGGLEVSFASSALIGLDAGLDDLLGYPYGCTEQLTSKLLPLGPLSGLGKAYGLKLGKNPELLRDRTVAAILTRQRGDGGFGMWPESDESSDWVTPYTLWVLHEARQSGAPVPQAALDRGREYLRRWLAKNIETQPAAAAFAVDALATLGAPDHGYMEKLWQRREELPTFSRGLLLHALVLGKSKDEKPRDLLARELENALRITGNIAKVVENVGDEYAALMDSPTRTTAIVLRALLAYRPNHELGSRLARGLLQARQRGAWRSTQETAFSLIGLDAYRRAQEQTTPNFQATARWGERGILSLEAEGKGLFSARGELGMAALQGAADTAVLIEKEGSGTLFYELRLRYARKTPPSTALDNGFFVQKTLRAVKAAELGAALATIPETGSTRFAAGDIVIADLVLVAPTPSNYVVLDDPLPAGFEAIDTSLTTTEGYLSDAGPAPDDDPADRRDAIAHRRAFNYAWHRRELRDDRALFFIDHLPAGMLHFRYLARATTLGTFVVPPTKAEEMYEPETFGRTAAAVIEVR